MRKIFSSLLIITTLSLTLLFWKDIRRAFQVNTAQQRINEFIKARPGDHHYPSKLMRDGKMWLSANLNENTSQSYCHSNKEINCNKFGRLYNWKVAQSACRNIGTGWRLPTNEEWQAMAKHYGGIVGDSPDNGKSAYVNLIAGGSSEFNALLGGNREPHGEYARLEAHGFYWTSSELDSANAWFYNFAKGATLLNRHTGDKKRAMSVRCVKDSIQ